jgi:hypothetical protein
LPLVSVIHVPADLGDYFNEKPDSSLAQGIIGSRPITAADLAQFGIVPRPGAPLEVRFRTEPDYETPTTYQASAGVQRDLGKGFSLEMSYLFTRGLHLTRNRDINQFRKSGFNPTFGIPCFVRFPAAVATSPTSCLGTASDFRNPLRFQDNIYESSANSFYHRPRACAATAMQRRRSRSASLRRLRRGSCSSASVSISERR